MGLSVTLNCSQLFIPKVIYEHGVTWRNNIDTEIPTSRVIW
jgi:hypothetical protein